jgi:hypothetical protein
VAYLFGAFPAQPPAGFILPAQPMLVSKPRSGPEWLHEIEHNGFRISRRRKLVVSRSGADAEPSYLEAAGIAEAPAVAASR